MDRRRSTRRTRTTSTTCSKALWLHQYAQRRGRGPAQAACSARRTSAPGRRPRACCATGATACPDALELLKKLAADAAPARPAGGGAGGQLLHGARGRRGRRSSPRSQPTDQYLDFVRGETMKALDPHREEGHRRGASRSTFTTAAGARYFLKNVAHRRPAEDEAHAGRSYLELLFRPGVRDEFRREALAGLAKPREEDGAEGAARCHSAARRRRQARRTRASRSTCVRLLTGRPRPELADVRGDLETLATSARQPVTRQLGLRRPDRRRRRRRTRRGRWRRSRSAALQGPGRRRAAGPRRRPASRRFTRRSSRCSTACRRSWRPASEGQAVQSAGTSASNCPASSGR